MQTRRQAQSPPGAALKPWGHDRRRGLRSRPAHCRQVQSTGNRRPAPEPSGQPKETYHSSAGRTFSCPEKIVADEGNLGNTILRKATANDNTNRRISRTKIGSRRSPRRRVRICCEEKNCESPFPAFPNHGKTCSINSVRRSTFMSSRPSEVTPLIKQDIVHHVI